MSIHLTDEQQTIVQAPVGHYVVTAVAGSGKTTTLAHRIRFLLNQGIPHKRILILMFNRSAREDFQYKLQQVLANRDASSDILMPEVRTFHALGYRLYQRFIKEGYLPAFKPAILSDKEQDFQIWRHLKRLLTPEQSQDFKRFKKEHLEISRMFIETVKAGLQAPEIVYEALNLDKKFAYLPDLFEQFEAWRKQQGRISYADMLYDTVHAIQRYPELANLVGNKMDIILVDEYQDTNDIQHALLKYIAGDRAKITVVGDPDQTIYEFRGAKPDYLIKGFREEFPEASFLSLSYSFRYGHAVALLANHLIACNQNRLAVICKAHDSNPDTQVVLHHIRDEHACLVNELSKLTPVDLAYSVILVRTWSQTVSIELALLSAGIPYHLDGHTGVFQSTELRAIESLLALSCGLFHGYSAEERQARFEQIFHFPHIGLADIQLSALASEMSQAANRYGEYLLGHIPSDITKFQTLKLERLAKTLADIETGNTNTAQLLQNYAEQIALYDGIRSLSFNHEQAEERVTAAKSIIGFLSRQHKHPLHVLNILSELARKAQFIEPDALKITTIHRAKGLEWQHVFIPGLVQNTFPSMKRAEKVTTATLESERRLLYVAMTRARQGLHLLAPAQDSEMKAPSVFVKELNFDQCTQLARYLYKKPADAFLLQDNQAPSSLLVNYARIMHCAINANPALKESPDRSDERGRDGKPIIEALYPGKSVIHSILGKGRIISLQSTAFNVEFPDRTTRTFSLEFAERFFTLDDSVVS